MAMRSENATLLNLIDSASEDEFQQANMDMILTPNSVIENVAPAKRKPGRQKAGQGKAAEQRPPTTQSIGAAKTKAKPTAARRTRANQRAALAEKPNPTAPEDVSSPEENDSEQPKKVARSHGGDENVKRLGKRGRPAKTAPNSSNVKQPPGESDNEGDDVEQADIVDTVQRSALVAQPSRNKRARVVRRAASVEPARVIPETQEDLEPMEIDMSEAEYIRSASAPKVPRSVSRAHSVTRQHPQSVTKRRPGSNSDTDRSVTEPTLRRKVGDLTKQLESINLKYRNLREIGVTNAEGNYDRLRRATEERAKAQEDLIASLRQELSIQNALGAEARSLQKQIVTISSERDKLASENKLMSKSLLDSQSEAKALSAKLAAARATQPPAIRAESAGPKVPGSAVKGSSQRPTPASNLDAAREAQRNQLKEELYRDLTGLVILGVKFNEEETVYDCIQTGRNGTLHFHLSIASQESGGKTSTQYEDSEFEYTPLLDENRDGQLLEVLPDCLKEEICFPGNQAAKFYIRIFDSMTKKVEYED